MTDVSKSAQSAAQVKPLVACIKISLGMHIAKFMRLHKCHCRRPSLNLPQLSSRDEGWKRAMAQIVQPSDRPLSATTRQQELKCVLDSKLAKLKCPLRATAAAAANAIAITAQVSSNGAARNIAFLLAWRIWYWSMHAHEAYAAAQGQFLRTNRLTNTCMRRHEGYRRTRKAHIRYGQACFG